MQEKKGKAPADVEEKASEIDGAAPARTGAMAEAGRKMPQGMLGRPESLSMTRSRDTKGKGTAQTALL